MISREKFEEIFENYVEFWKGDNVYFGLQIIAKYIDTLEHNIITSASHDKIASVDVDDLIDAGITEEDVINLRKFNWMMINDYLECFV